MQKQHHKIAATDPVGPTDMVRLRPDEFLALMQEWLPSLLLTNTDRSHEPTPAPKMAQQRSPSTTTSTEKHHEPDRVEPLLVDTHTACALLSCGRTKLFDLLNKPDGLQRVKIGTKTLVTTASIRELIEQGGA